MGNTFEHKKSLGQHFLNSDFVPKQMCDAGRVAPGDVVLEIGPGTGVLTREILAQGAQVIAVEADPRAIATLEESFKDAIARGQLTIFHDDARKLDLGKYGLIDHQFKIIANIPYYISGLLFRQCLESNIQPTDLVFLVQKEVAHRIALDPKESILSISIKIFGEPHYINTIKRGHFTPPPQVDSASIAIHDITRDRLLSIPIDVFFTLLQAAFGQRRKQLAGNLAPYIDKTTVGERLVGMGLPATSRAEDLSLEQFVALIKPEHTKNT